jgi:glucokinase
MTFNPVSAQDAARPLYIGVDIGGTNIKFGLVDDEGRTISRHSVPTIEERGPADAVERINAAIRKMVSDEKLDWDADIAGIGLVTPGPMDIPSGMVLETPNLPAWQFFNLKAAAEKEFGREIAFQNDANAAGYGEFWVGSGRDYESMILLTLGTGVGAGIILGDRILDGAHSHGGECGHMIINFAEDARTCPAGKGHLEAYASATAIVARAEEAMADGSESSLADRVDEAQQLTALMIWQEAEGGDALSQKLIDDTAHYLAHGIVNLLHSIDPEAVILGGAMNFGGHESVMGRRFLGEVKKEIHRWALPVPAEKTVVDFATLGGDAGYLGAAGVARLANVV